MIISDISLAIPHNHSNRVAGPIDRAKYNQTGHSELIRKRTSREATDTSDPMAGGELGVQLAPDIQVGHGIIQFFNCQPAECLSSISAVMGASRCREWNVKVDHVVILVPHQAVTEGSPKDIHVIRSERVCYQHHTNQPSSQISEILTQRRPVVATEQRVKANGITNLRAIDRTLDQPAPRTPELERTSGFLE
jgi:hypothetical protein